MTSKISRRTGNISHFPAFSAYPQDCKITQVYDILRIRRPTGLKDIRVHVVKIKRRTLLRPLGAVGLQSLFQRDRAMRFSGAALEIAVAIIRNADVGRRNAPGHDGLKRRILILFPQVGELASISNPETSFTSLSMSLPLRNTSTSIDGSLFSTCNVCCKGGHPASVVVNNSQTRFRQSFEKFSTNSFAFAEAYLRAAGAASTGLRTRRSPVSAIREGCRPAATE